MAQTSVEADGTNSGDGLKDWRINVPDPVGVCTDADKAIEAYKISAEMVDPHFADHAEPEELRRTQQ